VKKEGRFILQEDEKMIFIKNKSKKTGNFLAPLFLTKNRRGVSEIIGYILLIAIVVVISIFVYQWLKTYVPQEALTCPTETSVSVQEYDYNCTVNTLNFTLQNEGTFSIAGYFIHASNDSTQEIATIDLTQYYTGPGSHETSGGILFSYYNILDPGKAEGMQTNGFSLSVSPAIASGTLKEIEIIPIRFVEYKEKERLASCGNAKINIPITCT
jgi:flagellin-like protein